MGKKNKRSITVATKLSESEVKEFEELCRKLGKKKSEFLRELILRSIQMKGAPLLFEVLKLRNKFLKVIEETDKSLRKHLEKEKSN